MAKSGSNLLLIAHPSADPAGIASFLGITPTFLIVDGTAELNDEIFSHVEGCVMVVSAKTGISQEMISIWNEIVERQFPRMFLVSNLSFAENDFDDIAMILNRVCETVVTPALVLHDEAGQPAGLINLDNLTITDFTSGAAVKRPADDEMVSLVEEFRREYLSHIESFGDESVTAGLVVPAIPIDSSNGLGKEIALHYITLISKL